MLKIIIVGIYIFCVQFTSSHPLLLCPLGSQSLLYLFPVRSKMRFMSHIPLAHLISPAAAVSSLLTVIHLKWTVFPSLLEGFLGTIEAHSASARCTLKCWIMNTTEAKLQPTGMEVHGHHRLCVLQQTDSETHSTQFLRESPAGPSLSCPQGNLLTNIFHIHFSSLSLFPYFLLVLPEIASQINHMYPNPFLRAWFWELEVRKRKKQNETTIFSVRTRFDSDVHSQIEFLQFEWHIWKQTQKSEHYPRSKLWSTRHGNADGPVTWWIPVGCFQKPYRRCLDSQHKEKISFP